MRTDWMNDPLLQNIERYKLEFLQSMVFESNKLSPNSMLPFLLAAMKRGQKKNMSFSDAEIDAIVTVLKKYASPEELEKINLVLSIRKTGNVPDTVKNHPMMKNSGMFKK